MDDAAYVNDGSATALTDANRRASEVARRISREFLDAKAGSYFRARAIHWAQTDGEPDTHTWPRTPQGEEVRSRLGGDPALGVVAPSNAILTLEAFMLAHHAGESLMRHFFALADAKDKGSVIWLEMVSLQGASSFRKRLIAVRDALPEAIDKVIDIVFLPPELVEAIQKDGEDRPVEQVRRFCRDWLTHFACFYLEDANGYNAAKHGLSTIAGNSQVSFHPHPREWEGSGSPAPDAVVMFEGPEIRTVEYEKTGGQHRWFRVSRHVDPPALIAWTLMAADLLDWMWEIEKARTLGSSAEIRIRTAPLPEDVLRNHHTSWGQMRFPLEVLPLDGIAQEAVLRRLGLIGDD